MMVPLIIDSSMNLCEGIASTPIIKNKESNESSNNKKNESKKSSNKKNK